MSNKDCFIIGRYGYLANQLADSNANFLLYSPDHLEKIPSKSTVIYTSYKKGNSTDYHCNADDYLIPNLVHVKNAVELSLERKCKVFFIGSLSGYFKDRQLSTSNSNYGLTKAIASLIASEVSHIEFCNLVLPSIVGYPISPLPQLFEEVIQLANYDSDVFLQRWSKEKKCDHVVNLITIEEAVQSINKIVLNKEKINGNIFVSPSFVTSVGEFYNLVKRTVVDKVRPKTALGQYILQYSIKLKNYGAI